MPEPAVNHRSLALGSAKLVGQSIARAEPLEMIQGSPHEGTPAAPGLPVDIRVENHGNPEVRPLGQALEERHTGALAARDANQALLRAVNEMPGAMPRKRRIVVRGVPADEELEESRPPDRTGFRVWGGDELDWPHMPTMLENGNIMVFDNGSHRGWSRVIEVEPGQRVSRGAPLGRVGSTGKSTGYHLHYEVRLDGRPVELRKEERQEV